ASLSVTCPLSLHDALPISGNPVAGTDVVKCRCLGEDADGHDKHHQCGGGQRQACTFHHRRTSSWLFPVSKRSSFNIRGGAAVSPGRARGTNNTAVLGRRSRWPGSAAVLG